MVAIEAKDIIQHMYKGEPTSLQTKALKMAYEALDKQIPIRVVEVHVDEYFCPACGAENNCDQMIINDKYCPECGQALYQENCQTEKCIAKKDCEKKCEEYVSMAQTAILAGDDVFAKELISKQVETEMKYKDQYVYKK